MDREPRTVLLLLALAVLGHAARVVLGARGGPPGELLLPGGGPAADPARHRFRSEQAARPLHPGEVVDLNTASADEIARLPRIGMSLAKRIVQDRTDRGSFGGPGDLDRVPGVGPALLAALGDKVVYGGGARQEALPGSDASISTPGSYLPGTSPPGGEPIDLNSATEADLVALPGIGEARARAVLAYRRSHGSFAAVSDLDRVPGFSRALVRRLAPLVMVR